MTPTARFQETYFANLRQLLKQPLDIVITTHHRPDGDAIGSSLGLYNYLVRKGHRPCVITPNEYPDFLQWMPGNDSVIDFERNPAEAKRKIETASLVFCLDFNRLDRTEEMEDALRASQVPKVLIDHHLDPESIYDFAFSYPDASSTAELVFEFIESMGDKGLLDSASASCIYTGILTDTQSFRLPTVRPGLHCIVASLLEAGADNARIYEQVYENSTADRLRLLGYCLNNKLTVLPEYRTAYISLSQSEMDRYHFQSGDTEGVVNYALSIKGTVLAAFFSERDDLVKISFRSKAGFSVKDLAAKHFDGGGHKNASGGKSILSLEETVQKFLGLLPLYKGDLQHG